MNCGSGFSWRRRVKERGGQEAWRRESMGKRREDEGRRRDGGRGEGDGRRRDGEGRKGWVRGSKKTEWMYGVRKEVGAGGTCE